MNQIGSCLVDLVYNRAVFSGEHHLLATLMIYWRASPEFHLNTGQLPSNTGRVHIWKYAGEPAKTFMEEANE